MGKSEEVTHGGRTSVVTHRFQGADTLVTEGVPIDQGIVSLTRVLVDDKEVSTLEAGDYFAERALSEDKSPDETAKATIVATGPLVCYTCDRMTLAAPARDPVVVEGLPVQSVVPVGQVVGGCAAASSSSSFVQASSTVRA